MLFAVITIHERSFCESPKNATLQRDTVPTSNYWVLGKTFGQNQSKESDHSQTTMPTPLPRNPRQLFVHAGHHFVGQILPLAQRREPQVRTVKAARSAEGNTADGFLRNPLRHHFEAMGNHNDCWYLEGSRIIPRLLGWCEMDFVHPLYVHDVCLIWPPSPCFSNLPC